MTLAGVPVLVTGADGFIGSHLVERLVREGADVRAFCLYTSRGLAGSLDEAAADVRDRVEPFGDIRDPRVVERATEGVEVVFHFGRALAIRTRTSRRPRSSTPTSAARSTCSRRPAGPASDA